MKKLSLVALLVVFVASMVSVAFADDQDTPATGAGKSVNGFLKNSFNYSGKAVKHTAGMTANTLNNAGEKVV